MSTDGKWNELGYTEDVAARAIRFWDSPPRKALRKLEEDLEKLETTITALLEELK